MNENKQPLINFHHLRDVGETYIEHLLFNLWIAGSVIVLSVTSIIHAFFPFMFPRWPHAIAKYIFKKSLGRTMSVGRELLKKDKQ